MLDRVGNSVRMSDRNGDVTVGGETDGYVHALRAKKSLRSILGEAMRAKGRQKS